MGFNLDEVIVCRLCGALTLPDLQSEHHEFHRQVAALVAGADDSHLSDHPRSEGEL